MATDDPGLFTINQQFIALLTMLSILSGQTIMADLYFRDLLSAIVLGKNPKYCSSL
jgi:hypothetical protein